MTTLTITRGLPGSGKSTWARMQQTADPNLWRVNRDALRAMALLHWAHGNQAYEDMLTRVQRAAIRALLANGVDVVVDDINLQHEHVNTLMAIAVDCRADFQIEDFTNVPLETCIERDAARSDAERVGADKIRAMHALYLAGAGR